VGQVFDEIDASLAAWIAEQPMWFVATAPLEADGRIHVSPRGHDSLAVLGPHRVGWVDYTGSGVETIAHLRQNGRICLMFCSFGRRPRVVRLHGRGRSTRAVITVDVERISDSCGFGVPLMTWDGERDLLRASAEKRGPDGLAAYRAELNAASIDGLPGL
jgi:hypothetical protein